MEKEVIGILAVIVTFAILFLASTSITGFDSSDAMFPVKDRYLPAQTLPAVATFDKNTKYQTPQRRQEWINQDYDIKGPSFSQSSNYFLSITKLGSTPGRVDVSDGSMSCGSYCYQKYPRETKLTLTAVPDKNGVFGGWSNACTGDQINCTLTMNSVKFVQAEFIGQSARKLFLQTSGKGKVVSEDNRIDCGSDCFANYQLGSKVTLTAIPNNGSTFAGWQAGWACRDTEKTCRIIMSADNSVMAKFN